MRMLKGALSQASWKCENTLPGHSGSVAISSGTKVAEHPPGSSQSSFRRPAYIQAPHYVPSLHPFSWSSIFFLFREEQATLPHITVKATTSSGDTDPVDILLEHAQIRSPNIHHLAAKAIMLDLETSQSWMHAAASYSDISRSEQVTSTEFEEMVRQEAEHIGLKWSVTGKWTSFVAGDHTESIYALQSFTFRIRISDKTSL